MFSQSAHLDDGLQPDRRVCIETTKPVPSQDAVFAHNRHYICGDADGAKIQQGYEFVKFDPIADRESLHKLEADAATGKMRVRIMIILTLRVKNSHGRRQFNARHVMIADDKIDA